MVWEGTRGQNMRPNKLSHYILKSSMNTVLFVNATIGFSENLFLVDMCNYKVPLNYNGVTIIRKFNQR